MAAWVLPLGALCAWLAGIQPAYGAEGTAWSVQSLSATNAEFIRRTQNGVLTPRQIWNLETSLEVYKRQTNRNSRWDAAALEALETFALTRGLLLNAEVHALEERIARRSWKAVQEGCRDPLVRFVHLRLHRFSYSNAAPMAAVEFKESAWELARSVYPAIRKYYGCIEAVQQGIQQRDFQSEWDKLTEAALEWLVKALADRQMPAEDAYSICSELLSTCRPAGVDAHAVWKRIEPQVRAKLEGTHFALVLSGEAHLHWAWQARGGGWADKVKPEAWRLMEARLKLARTDLEKAWNLDPRDHRAATAMLGVLLLESAGPAEVDTWFNRAMQETNNLMACHKMLMLLSPSWGGAPERLMAFGRRCLTNVAWVPLVAEIVPQAYGTVGRSMAGDRSAFFQDAAVWADVKAAYLKLIRLYPWQGEYRDGLRRWARSARREAEVEKLLSP